MERKPKEQHCMQAAFSPFPPKDVRAGRLVVELLTEEVCHAYASSSHNELNRCSQTGTFEARNMPHRRQRHLRIFAAYVRVRRGLAKRARKRSTTRCSYMLSPTAAAVALRLTLSVRMSKISLCRLRLFCAGEQVPSGGEGLCVPRRGHCEGRRLWRGQHIWQDIQ